MHHATHGTVLEQSLWHVHEGDCLTVLAELPDDCIDAIVQDPPAGINFMGRKWDNKRGYKPVTERGVEVLAACKTLGLQSWEAGFVTFMTEVAAAELRVTKPGAHSLTWALPRTADLTALALRLAGWEVRDSIVNLFGGGFPKSLDVSKAIDKAAGAERKLVGANSNSRAGQAECSIDGDAPNFRATYQPITAPATEAAKQWAGWGTALSPGHEQWILARKPFAGTVAATVLTHGTGAINVDGCRTPTGSEGNPTLQRRAAARKAGRAPGLGRSESDGLMERRGSGETYLVDKPGEHLGRWPKNALLSCALACEGDQHSPGCPGAELDQQSGMLTTGSGNRASAARHTYGGYRGTTERDFTGDSAGVSRYFPRFGYHPKASDRTVPGRPDLVNKHPTHKHPELMRWLVRLITPPGGVVLDPFAGSGTTGVAALLEGACFIGIEQDAAHAEVARLRVAEAATNPDYYNKKRRKKKSATKAS